MRKTGLLAAAAVVAILGVFISAGPASAFAPYPGPIAPLPVATSTELAAAGEGALGDAILAGLGIVPVIGAVGGVAVGGLGIGVGVGGIIDRLFNLNGNDICSWETGTDGTGSGSVVSGAINAVSGAECLTEEARNILTSINSDAPQSFTLKVCAAAPSTFCETLDGKAFTDLASNPALVYCVTESGLGTPGIVTLNLPPTGGYTNGSEVTALVSSSVAASNGWSNGAGVNCATEGWELRLPNNTAGESPPPVPNWGQMVGGLQASPTVGGKSNPEREWVCVITGSNGQSYNGTSALFTEADDTIPHVLCPLLPTGVTPTHEKVTEVTPDGSTPTKTILDKDPTPQYTAAKTAYPQCATGACELQVYSQNPQPAACVVDSSICATWFTDPTKSADYKCEYGPSGNPTLYTPPLAECNVLSKYYEGSSQATGSPWTDPATGLPVGPKTGDTLDKDLMTQSGSSVDPDGSNSDCYPSGWGVLNPLSWVLQPLECGLRWAFVPRTAVLEQTTTSISTAWGQTVFAQAAPLVAQFATVPSSTGCSGIPVDINETWPVPWSLHWNFGAACTAPMSSWAALVSGVLGAIVVCISVLAVVRYIASALGFTGFGRLGQGSATE